MSIIYNVTIEPTETVNRFQVTWHDVERNSTDCFIGEIDISLKETQLLWQQSQFQPAIGQKLFRFLDGDSRHFMRALDLANQQGEPLLVYLFTCKKTADWPFELLARNDTFLLPSQLHLVRCVSNRGIGKTLSPQNRPLKLLFLACSARDVKPVLDYEREEEAIYGITKNLAMDMEVEDSGSLEGLRSRLEQQHYDVVHLSGHANIDRKKGPYFIMENETGHKHPVFPEMLWDKALIENPPRLLFLSGCRTGENFNRLENVHLVSFARLMVERFLPAVLGWGRSVSDKQASHAGKMIYHELSRGKSILDAVKRARYELHKDFPGSSAPAWPLLRLFSNGIPLNAIVKKGQQWQPKPRQLKHICLGNSRIKVLSEGFRGRRRQLQTSLYALKRDFDKVGVVLLGAAGIGKSCLAGKICERFPHHNLIIIQGKLNAITLEAAVKDAFIVSQDQKGQQILSDRKKMTDKLANLCATSFKEKNYLMLLDAFDQNLERADKGQPGLLQLEAVELLKVLLHYLPFSGKMTQLIITSRNNFSLSHHGRDLAEERLEKVWLTSIPGQRDKDK
jgi:hypothetical protein